MGQRGGDHSLPLHLGLGNGFQVVHFRDGDRRHGPRSVNRWSLPSTIALTTPAVGEAEGASR